MTNKKKSLKLAKSNSLGTNLRKTIEELTELSLELQHKINKPHKVNDKKIVEEIAHVKIRLWWLEEEFGKVEVKKEETKKLKSLNHVNNRRRIYQKVQ